MRGVSHGHPDVGESSSSRSATQLLERHEATATEWFPHEYVPWGRGRDFVSREEWWDPADTRGLARPAARSS